MRHGLYILWRIIPIVLKLLLINNMAVRHFNWYGVYVPLSKDWNISSIPYCISINERKDLADPLTLQIFSSGIRWSSNTMTGPMQNYWESDYAWVNWLISSSESLWHWLKQVFTSYDSVVCCCFIYITNIFAETILPSAIL